jgi:hypothetical protein
MISPEHVVPESGLPLRRRERAQPVAAPLADGCLRAEAAAGDRAWRGARIFDDRGRSYSTGCPQGALFAAGLSCRADDRGDPVIQLAPPLICGKAEFDGIEQVLRGVLTEAWSRL